MNQEETTVTHINPMLSRDFVQIFFIGLVIGSAAWVLYQLFGRYLFTPLLCGQGTSGSCTLALHGATVLASVISAAIALIVLIRYRVSRPLLAVIAVTICLWGLMSRVAPLGGLSSVFMIMLMYSLCYALFAWIMRIRNSWVVVGATIPLVLIVRLIMVY